MLIKTEDKIFIELQTFSFQNQFINQYKNVHFNDATVVYRQIS